MFNPDRENLQDQEEPAFARGLSKAALYKFVGSRFVLPDLDARCTTRPYLIRVQQGEVFRVSREDLLTFEARITSDETTKASFFHIGVLRERLDRFLELTNQPRFGFPPGSNPDDGWFVRILRYVDRSNILLGFKRAVANSQVPRNQAGRM